jgi:hypothetical protein
MSTEQSSRRKSQRRSVAAKKTSYKEEPILDGNKLWNYCATLKQLWNGVFNFFQNKESYGVIYLY